MEITREGLVAAVNRVNKMLAANGKPGDVHIVIRTDDGVRRYQIKSHALPIGWRTFDDAEDAWQALHMAADLMWVVAKTRSSADSESLASA